MKRPAFQFYVADWQGNANLKRCTHAEKGIWVDVLCLMHDAEPQYGIIRWPLKEIAQAVSCKLSDLQSLVRKGVMKGADTGQECEPFIYTPRSGGKDGQPVVLIDKQLGPIWYSSRMVRDEHVRLRRGEGTRFGDESKGKPKSPPKGGIGDDIGKDKGHGPSIFSLQSSEEERGAKTHAREDVPLWDTEFYQKLETIVGWVKPPSALDLEAWFRTGADEALILETVEHVMKTSLQGIPPGSITYFDNPIARAVARRDRKIDVPTIGENYAGKPTHSHRKPTPSEMLAATLEPEN